MLFLAMIKLDAIFSDAKVPGTSWSKNPVSEKLEIWQVAQSAGTSHFTIFMIFFLYYSHSLISNILHSRIYDCMSECVSSKALKSWQSVARRFFGGSRSFSQDLFLSGVGWNFWTQDESEEHFGWENTCSCTLSYFSDLLHFRHNFFTKMCLWLFHR